MNTVNTGVSQISVPAITVGAMFPEPPYLVVDNSGVDGWITVDVRPDVADWLFETFISGVDYRWISSGHTLYVLVPIKILAIMALRW